MAATTSRTKEINKLRAENRRLKAELAKNNVSDRRILRSSGIIIFASLATTLLVLGNIVFWSARTLVNTNDYMTVVGPLVEEPEVQEAIAKKTTETLFETIDVSAVAAEALPPRAEFLAKPLTNQLKEFTEKALQKIVASEQFQNIWLLTNRNAHERLVGYVRNNQGEGRLKLGDLYQQLAERLNNSNLAFLSDKQLPTNVGDYEVTNTSWLPVARWVANNLNLVRGLAVLTFVGITALAVWISKHRRSLLIRLSLLYAGMMFVLLIAVRIAGSVVVGKVDAQYQAAASKIYSALTHGLIVQTWILIAMFLLVAFAVWATSKNSRAAAVRTRLQLLFGGELHKSVFGNKKETDLTKWVGKYRRALLIVILVVGILSLLVIPISMTAVLAVLTFMLILALVVSLLSAPIK